MNRRDLLKFFGVGTLITPVVGGQPVVEAAAKLLAIPSIEGVANFPDGHAPALYSDRLKWNPYEALWLAMWQIENNPPSWINYGVGPLEHVLGREPTQAEKSAVAALVQWFGSNCGHCFIGDVLRASGYKVERDPSPRADHVKALQTASVWGAKYPPPPISLPHKGGRIELKYGEFPVVTA